MRYDETKMHMLKRSILPEKTLFIPTASFDDAGGWFVDSEFILELGFPYLLAHGLGVPVPDAKKTITITEGGIYHLYAYTYNWVAPWHPDMAPGCFNVRLGGQVSLTLGKTTTQWGWEDGGTVSLSQGPVDILLHDLTGFEGRCAYLVLTQMDGTILPQDRASLFAWYQEATNNREPEQEGRFDFLVAGGGIAGMCTAVTAAREGLSTALVQDRRLVGGNNSSEIRVWLGGGTNYAPYPGIGNIVGEFEQHRIGHYGAENKAQLYEDDRKMGILQAQKGLDCFLGCCVIGTDTSDECITSVLVWDYVHDHLFRLSAPLYADATGDGNLGFLAHADYETTTNGHMGVSNLWHIEHTGRNVAFPRCPWAVDLSQVAFPGRGNVHDIYGNSREKSLGCWFWESGMENDPFLYAERARDMNFRAMYGAWDVLRNVDHDYEGYELTFCAAVAGKRESRRLLGDVVLTKADFKKPYSDGCVPATWDFDVHYPDKRFYAAFHEGDAFLTMDCRESFQKPFFLPYRCLYSRNIRNMFMAGRNISTSHDASGTARIMRTGGMMGEVVGYAAAMCHRYRCLPRDIFESHRDVFLQKLASIPKKEVEKVGDTID